MALLVGVTWAGTGSEARAREAGAADGASAQLVVARTGSNPRGESHDSALLVRPRPEGAADVSGFRVEDWHALASPDGKRQVVELHDAHGMDLAVREGDGEPRRLTRDPADEWPMDWAPDSRRLVYRYSDRRNGDSLYVTHLAVVDAVGGEVLRFPVTHPARADSQAVWSPAGTAVAFTGSEDGRSDVWVADADGRRETDVSGDPAPDGHPAWSPDGRWLAFASRRGGSWDVWLVRPDGTGLSRLTFSPEDETSPAWISGREVAYVADRGGSRDLWAVDVTSRKVRRLTSRGDVARVRSVRRPDARGRVARVQVEPRFRAVSPGQRIGLQAEVVDARGRPVPPGAARVRWRSSDPAVVRVGPDGGAEVLSEGEAVLTASAGGWKADTLRVVSRALAELPRLVLLAEDWRSGIDPGRWIPAGAPPSEVVRGEGPSGAAFLNNGDENYKSGVFTRRELPLEDGLSVAWWARLPFAGRNYQNLLVGLTTGTEPRPGHGGPPHPDVLLFAASALPARHHVSTHHPTSRDAGVPLPADPEAWHRYGLELRPDGSVLYLVDGRLRWRSPPGFVDRVPDRARLEVAGGSLRARILAGPVTVWRGQRWTIPGEGGSEAGAP